MAPRAILHWNPAPGSPLKLHEGFALELVAGGDEVIDGAAGAVVSSVYVLVAAALLLPAASTARTLKV